MIASEGTLEGRRELGLLPPDPAWPRIKHAAALIGGFWRSDQWPIAWLTLAFCIAYQFLSVYLFVYLNDWDRRFFDAMEAKDVALLGSLMITFLELLVVMTLIPLLSQYASSTLALRWRIWLTQRYMTRWLAGDAYYRIEHTRVIDNPDQRISDDVTLLTEGVLNNVLGFISATAQAISFSVVLWSDSRPIAFSLFGSPIRIPGDMVIYAWVYALVGSWIVAKIARPLVQRTMRQQHMDADFRFGLIGVRRNSEQIAFTRAAGFELSKLDVLLQRVRTNFRRLIFAQLQVAGSQTVYGRIGEVLPLLVLLPRYLVGAISLGQVMQLRGAVGQLQSALSWFTQAYGTLAGLVATVNRLKALDDAIDRVVPPGITVVYEPNQQIVAQELSIFLPDGSPLLDVGTLNINRGERWVVTGASGTGKSTFLRALSGLWPYGQGQVSMPSVGVTMFIPQRLYLPSGTLKEAISFPSAADAFTDERVEQALERCRIAQLIPKLGQVEPWLDTLSPGEQQRLGLVRVLLHRPDFLLLDEATSALDPDNALYFYRTLLRELPGLTLVSVVHADNLTQFHDHAFTLAGGTAHQSRVEPQA